MFTVEEERFRLAIPLRDAIAFAMGWSDLGYEEPKTELRKIVGFLAIDALEYSEQWRTAALLRTCLEHRWA
jgi:hypothetical protein